MDRLTDCALLQRWYALHVRSRHEKSVSAQLQAKCCNIFLPLYSTKHRWADRSKIVSLPLFPGYVFCHFDASMQSSVLTTSGVIDVVRVGAQAAPIENSEIDAIRRIVDSPLSIEPHAALVPGESVTLRAGPLKGLTGTLVDIRNSLRLVVSVEILRRSVLIEIERDWAVPSGQSDRAGKPNTLRRDTALVPRINTRIERAIISSAMAGG